MKKKNIATHDATHSDEMKNLTHLLRPRKPVVPYLGKEPQKKIIYNKDICIYRGQTLAELLKEIPTGIKYEDVRINDTYGDELYLEYDEIVENQNYESEMMEYEKKKIDYELKMKIYMEQKRIYDEWAGLSDEEKRSRQDELKRVVKRSKIEQLEKQLEELKKDVGV